MRMMDSSNRRSAVPKRACLAGMALLLVPALCMAEIYWEPPWEVRANGQRISVEAFSSQSLPDAVAQELAGRNRHYQRFLVGAGRILLSGVSPEAHWLADIQGSAEGSRGYVSALYFDAARSQVHWADVSAPRQVYEFESSVFVALSQQAGPPPAMPAGSARSTSFLSSDTQAGMSVAVSIPEP